MISYMTGEITDMLSTKKPEESAEGTPAGDLPERKETPVLSGRDIKTMLKDSGVSEEGAAAFEEGFERAFGKDAVLPAVNVVESGKFSVKTPSVTIRTDAEHSNLIETKTIDGKRYLTILIDGDVEVNGVPVQ